MLQDVRPDISVKLLLSDYLRQLMALTKKIKAVNLQGSGVKITRDMAEDFYSHRMLVSPLQSLLAGLYNAERERRGGPAKEPAADELFPLLVQLIYDEFSREEILAFEKLCLPSEAFESVSDLRLNSLDSKMSCNNGTGEAKYNHTMITGACAHLFSQYSIPGSSQEDYQANILGSDYSERIKKLSKGCSLLVKEHSPINKVRAITFERDVLNMTRFHVLEGEEGSAQARSIVYPIFKRHKTTTIQWYKLSHEYWTQVIENEIRLKRSIEHDGHRFARSSEVVRYVGMLLEGETFLLEYLARDEEIHINFLNDSATHIVTALRYFETIRYGSSLELIRSLYQKHAELQTRYVNSIFEDITKEMKEDISVKTIMDLNEKAGELIALLRSADTLLNASEKHGQVRNVHSYLLDLSTHMQKVEAIYIELLNRNFPEIKTEGESDQFRAEYFQTLLHLRCVLKLGENQFIAYASKHGLSDSDYSTFRGRRNELLGLELKRMDVMRRDSKQSGSDAGILTAAHIKWLVKLIKLTSEDVVKNQFLLDAFGLLPLALAIENQSLVCTIFCALFWLSTVGFQLIRGTMLCLAKGLNDAAKALQGSCFQFLGGALESLSALIGYVFDPIRMVQQNTRLVPGMSRVKQIFIAVASFTLSVTLIGLSVWLLLPYILPAIAVLAPVCLLMTKFALGCEILALFSAALLFVVGERFATTKIIPGMYSQKKSTIKDELRDQYPVFFSKTDPKAVRAKAGGEPDPIKSTNITQKAAL